MKKRKKKIKRITPLEAARKIRESKGMTRYEFNRLWQIAMKGGILPI